MLTGSSADSFKDPEWNKQLKARLAAAVKRQQRILGICYGHQVMARVLGGETGTCQALSLVSDLIHLTQLNVHQQQTGVLVLKELNDRSVGTRMCWVINALHLPGTVHIVGATEGAIVMSKFHHDSWV